MAGRGPVAAVQRLRSSTNRLSAVQVVDVELLSVQRPNAGRGANQLVPADEFLNLLLLEEGLRHRGVEESVGKAFESVLIHVQPAPKACCPQGASDTRKRRFSNPVWSGGCYCNLFGKAVPQVTWTSMGSTKEIPGVLLRFWRQLMVVICTCWNASPIIAPTSTQPPVA